jgi:hypothetical protein
LRCVQIQNAENQRSASCRGSPYVQNDESNSMTRPCGTHRRRLLFPTLKKI